MSRTEPGRRVIDGRFELVGRLGGGGMGWVWRARDLALHREVAVKEVRPPDPGLAEYDPEGARTLRERVLREARALARVHHPNVVTIHHIVDGGEGTYPWIVMELLTGGSLQDRLDRGRLEPSEAARMGREVLDALRAAHAVGIEHRDVKPANVLLRPDGRPVLTDFGIAAVREATSLTATGSVIGSPDYMAPERVSGKEGGPASDLWSLAMMLYVAVEAHHPLRRDSTLATLAAVLSEDVPPPRQAGPLTGVLTALLVKDPLARPGAEEVDRMLAVAAGQAPPPATSGTPADAAPAFGPAPGFGPPPSFGPPPPAETSYRLTPPSGTGPSGTGPSGAGASGTGPLGPGHSGPVGFPTSGAQGAGSPTSGGASPWSPTGQGGPAVPDLGVVPQPATKVTGGGSPPRRRPVLAVVTSVAATALTGVLVWTLLPDSGNDVKEPRASATSPAGDKASDATASTDATKDDEKSDVGDDGTSKKTGDLLTEEGLRTTAAKFKAVMGGSKVTRYVVYPEYAMAEAPVKGKEKLYDSFSYRGGDVAVKDGPGGTITSGDGPADLDDFAWDAVPGLFRKADKTLGVDNPTSRYLVINPPGVFDDEPTMSVYLANDYGGGYLKANTKGQTISTYPMEAG
ncbi:serine/threonine protein kinase [Streptomyces ossamyceticus]|jgi:eukaryotic-like serine/threonine-protein kinase|uniref:serine/threonine-protein kinase n=1 Tax=Streptomyces ossamyceticus TaxID=249581 RepID=UPI000F481223